jgi:hypothetical protein
MYRILTWRRRKETTSRRFCRQRSDHLSEVLRREQRRLHLLLKLFGPNPQLALNVS